MTNFPNQFSENQLIGQFGKLSPRARIGSVAMIGLIAGSVLVGSHAFGSANGQPLPPPPPAVTVSSPLQQDIGARLQALGQFSAVEHVELRAQVGGTLTEIGFKDGDIVHKGDLLFVIDPTPYEIKLSEANAMRESAKAKLTLASRELIRAVALKQSGAGTTENSDQRFAEQKAAQAEVDNAEAQVRDAQFDLDHCRILAPFTGRIGSHQVSVGNLIAGSRAGTSPTTLLSTIVSLDPIYLNFDMSEGDYSAFLHQREKEKGALADKVSISLGDETKFDHDGTLDFIDNSLDRSSGTIHARATVPNTDYQLTPGAFGRVRVAVSDPTPTLLVPDSAVLPDQSNHIVFTIDKDNVVTPKPVEIGDLRGNLRVIRSGLTADDRVIVEGITSVAPGKAVTPTDKKIEASNDKE